MKEDALVQFKLMLPAALKARVEGHAIANRRSLSQEIVSALEERFPAPKWVGPTFDDLYRMMDHIGAAGSEVEEDARLKLANQTLSESGQSIRLRLSSERDQRGRRQIFMSTDERTRP